MVAGLAAEQSIVIPDTMLSDAGIAVHHREVTAIDPEAKQVKTSSGQSYSYDKLFLAMGSSPFIPPIEGRELEGVVTLRDLVDAAAIKKRLTSGGKKIVFIGAGFISMEIAALLAEQGGDAATITVVELMDRVLPLMLDGDMAEGVQQYLTGEKVNFITGDKVEKIIGQNGKVEGVLLASGQEIAADLVFLNIGVRPNLELARDIGLEMGDFGIKVNGYQETSMPDILAGGDCVQKYNFITGKPTAGQLRGPAVVQGRLAAKRLAGFDISFPGVLDAGGCKMLDMTVTATGLTETRAKEEGFETVSAIVDSRSKHGMIAGMVPWRLKLVFDKNSHRLLGGQIVSRDIAPAREIDAVSAFIFGGKTIAELTTFTSACNPDISSEPSAEPITIAAEQALQKSLKP